MKRKRVVAYVIAGADTTTSVDVAGSRFQRDSQAIHTVASAPTLPTGSGRLCARADSREDSASQLAGTMRVGPGLAT